MQKMLLSSPEQDTRISQEMSNTEETTKTKADFIIEMIEATAKTPMVTPRFGNEWKKFTKEKFENGQMSVDDIIDIAFYQGRKALLLEEALRQNT